MQLRDAEIESPLYTNQAGNASYISRQNQPSRVILLAALDAAQLAGDRSKAMALIELIYSSMDTDYAATEQDD